MQEIRSSNPITFINKASSKVKGSDKTHLLKSAFYLSMS